MLALRARIQTLLQGHKYALFISLSSSTLPAANQDSNIFSDIYPHTLDINVKLITSSFLDSLLKKRALNCISARELTIRCYFLLFLSPTVSKILEFFVS